MNKYLLCLCLVVLPAIASAQTNGLVPSLTLSLGEGYVVSLKDGNPSPGSVNTRFVLLAGWGIGKGFGVSVGGGICTPNDMFKPAPRAVVAASYALSAETSLVVFGVYQFNPGYNPATPSHTLLAALGLTHRISGRVSLGLDLGGGKTIGGAPSLLIQPRIGFMF